MPGKIPTSITLRAGETAASMARRAMEILDDATVTTMAETVLMLAIATRITEKSKWPPVAKDPQLMLQGILEAANVAIGFEPLNTTCSND